MKFNLISVNDNIYAAANGIGERAIVARFLLSVQRGETFPLTDSELAIAKDIANLQAVAVEVPTEHRTMIRVYTSLMREALDAQKEFARKLKNAAGTLIANAERVEAGTIDPQMALQFSLGNTADALIDYAARCTAANSAVRGVVVVLERAGVEGYDNFTHCPECYTGETTCPVCKGAGMVAKPAAEGK